MSSALVGDLTAVGRDLGSLVERDHPLGPHTTYRVGGPASLFVEAASMTEIEAVRRALSGRSIPLLVVGRGSNLLVADRGFLGLVLHLGQGFSAIDLPAPHEATAPADHDTNSTPNDTDGAQDDTVMVRAGAAVALPVLARRTVEANLAGLEWAVGVPGSVGGAVRMNAGGHGSDTASRLVRYAWVDLAHESGGVDGKDRLQFSYRHSNVQASQLVLWAEFALRQVDAATGQAGRAELAEIVRWRREHQPGGANAGSVFTNPPGDSAGRLVEAAGLKGHRLGTAHVSEKHANFIQADEGGSANDVMALIDLVRRIVAERSGVMLQTEVRLIGFEADETGAVTTSTPGAP
jgi:UDP-N-acetylmuramate dehydrogenase